jgi:hypothetical protein
VTVHGLHLSFWNSVTLLFVGLTAIGTIWQGYSVQQALKTPYSANFQNRLIDVCADFLFKAGALRSDYSTWSTWARGEIRVTGVQLDDAQLRTNVRRSGLDLGPSMEKLSLLSSAQAKDELKSLSSAKTALFVLLDPPVPGDKATETAWLKQYDDNLANIEKRCSDVMLGNRTGVL